MCIKNKISLTYNKFIDNENKVNININSNEENEVTAIYFKKEIIEDIERLKDMRIDKK